MKFLEGSVNVLVYLNVMKSLAVDLKEAWTRNQAGRRMMSLVEAVEKPVDFRLIFPPVFVFQSASKFLQQSFCKNHTMGLLDRATKYFYPNVVNGWVMTGTGRKGWKQLSLVRKSYLIFRLKSTQLPRTGLMSQPSDPPSIEKKSQWNFWSRR